MSMESSKAGTKEEKSSDGLNYSSGLPSPQDRNSSKQRMNYLMIMHIPSTTTWRGEEATLARIIMIHSV